MVWYKREIQRDKYTVHILETLRTKLEEQHLVGAGSERAEENSVSKMKSECSLS